MREKYTVEQVQDAIRRDPDITGKARDSLDAIIEGRLPEHFLQLFRRKRDDYSDELPDVDVRDIIDAGIIQNDFKGRIHTYKCQGNYVRGLSFIDIYTYVFYL